MKQSPENRVKWQREISDKTGKIYTKREYNESCYGSGLERVVRVGRVNVTLQNSPITQALIYSYLLLWTSFTQRNLSIACN